MSLLSTCSTDVVCYTAEADFKLINKHFNLLCWFFSPQLVTFFGALLAAVHGLPTHIDYASVYTGAEPSTYDSAYVTQEQLAYAPTYSKAVDYYVSWHAIVGHCTGFYLTCICDFSSHCIIRQDVLHLEPINSFILTLLVYRRLHNIAKSNY
jgi:hypothetical protein